MNRTDRLLALILHLHTRRHVTAEQLAEHFGLSVRTIYRDLAALGEAGVPIAVEAGLGYSLMKGYSLPPVSFTEQEASALATGGMLVGQLTDESLRGRMRSALAKVRAVLPATQQARLDVLESSLSSAAKPVPAQVSLDLLQQALSHRRVLCFGYQGVNRDEATEREVEPQGLIYYMERWHLIGWCRLRGDYRDFRTDRMRDVRMLDETTAPRGDFKSGDFMRCMPAATLHARLHFTRQAADRALREWWLGLVEEQVQADGHVLVLSTTEWAPLATWLLSFGNMVRVLEPQPLRDELVRQAGELARHHGH
ncbi:helix-turn-helix transcriptional regulator [Pseudomonas sp. LRF_L74]|uniref:helix-turn-helix transcriptional regulator n=1 Tax=Pseudomonas sp. LRF_L74 TaxID=3369422 RepID=UPI003F61D0F8